LSWSYCSEVEVGQREVGVQEKREQGGIQEVEGERIGIGREMQKH